MKVGCSVGIFSLLILAGAAALAQTRPTKPAPETQAAVPSVSNSNAAARTSLEIKVVGVLAIGDGTDRRSSAIIATKGSKTSQTYSPGQVIDGNADARIVRVQNERVEFMNQGRLEFAPVQRFPEAGWGGNAPVTTSSPATPSSAGGSSYSATSSVTPGAGADGASDRLQALKDARRERLQQRAKGGAAGAEGATPEKPAE